jgi:hypothetical protein
MAAPWGRIKADFMKGGVTYKELAAKYGLSVKTIQNHASNEGWAKEKGTFREEIGKAMRARAVRAKIEELDKLITANERMADALMKLTEEIQKKPMILLGRGDGKAADAISKAILTTVQCQRDLYKLPTLDQDMRKREEAQRKREAKAKMELEREKFELDKIRKQNETGADGVLWRLEEPEGVELDG